MPKLTLSDVNNLGGNPVSAQQVINTNSDRIEAAVENTLSRNGASPNQMEADFDMNNHDILNSAEIHGEKLFINGVQIEGAAAWMSGSGYPSSSLGKLGDFYLDKISGEVYGPKTPSGWGMPVANLKGPIGPQGPQGVQGLQGVQGIQGIQGVQGPEGPRGIQGVQGLKGDSFDPDAVGLASDRSLYDDEPENFSFLDTENGYLYFKKSDTSGDWTSGVPFTAGPQGPVGPEGPEGAQGDQGPQGVQGVQGPAGVGVPSGGSAGQVLTKNTGTDYDTSWQNADADFLIRPEQYGLDGAGFNAAIAAAQARGNVGNTGPAPVYLFDSTYAPAGGYDVSDSLIYKAPGTTLYTNPAGGFLQYIDTLPDTFDSYQLDPYQAIRYFDAQVKDSVDPSKTNGLLKAGAPMTSASVFGSRSPAIGTPLAFRGTMEVHDVGTPDIGYNEIGGIYNHIVVHGDKTQPASKYSIWAHDTIAMTGKQRPKWFGASFRFHNMANANPSGGTGFGEGLSGISVMQRPLYADDATYAGYLSTDPVYPMAAGMTISGYGGPQTATDGTHVDALHAFYTGLQIGGSNSPYLGETSRSKILQGIVINDYTLSGLLISSPHPSFNADPASGTALTVAANAGAVNLGVASPSQTAAIHIRHATDGNIKLYPQSGQQQMIMRFGSQGLLGTDLSGANANTFGYYHLGANAFAFSVDASARFQLPNLPTSASGLAAGTLWRDAAAGNVLKVA